MRRGAQVRIRGVQSLESAPVAVYSCGAMTLEFLAKGFLIGLFVAAPLGPVAILVMHRVLAEQRRRAGFVSGLGAAAADLLYACVAGGLFSFVASLLDQYQLELRIGGALLLGVLGAKLMRSHPHDTSDPDQRGTLWSHFMSTLLLTLSNPATFLAFSGCFAVWGPAGDQHTFLNIAVLVVGVALGSLAWFGGLSFLVGLARLHLTNERMRWVNIICGVLMIVFGIVVLINTIGMCYEKAGHS
jgi:threonine/homoserine/homoserine lactone efflux protein